jgi:hypothetical protein
MPEHNGLTAPAQAKSNNDQNGWSRRNRRALNASTRSNGEKVARVLSPAPAYLPTHLPPLLLPPPRPRRLVRSACRTSASNGEDASHGQA